MSFRKLGRIFLGEVSARSLKDCAYFYALALQNRWLISRKACSTNFNYRARTNDSVDSKRFQVRKAKFAIEKPRNGSYTRYLLRMIATDPSF